MRSFVSLFILNTCVTVCVSCASSSSSSWSSLGGVCLFLPFLSAHLVDLSLHFFWPKHTNDLRESQTMAKNYIYYTLRIWHVESVVFGWTKNNKQKFRLPCIRARFICGNDVRKIIRFPSVKLDVVVGHQRFEQCF